MLKTYKQLPILRYNNMKVAIYCRVSTDDQTTENQRLILTNYCERMSYDYEVFVETESSRKTRPIQYNLYQRLLRKEFDGLIIYKFDRWARSTQELVQHMNDLHNKGILIYSYVDNVDLNSSMGKAMLTIISAFAQLERDIIRERTLAGLQRARAWGKKLGRPKGMDIKKAAPIEAVKGLLSQAKDEREIARILETSRYRVRKAIEKIKATTTEGDSVRVTVG